MMVILFIKLLILNMKLQKHIQLHFHGIVSEENIKELQNGVKIDDSYITRPAKARIMKIDKEKNFSRVEITIHEGKNRQVRRMCEAIGKRVIALHRSKIGNISVKDIELGKWRYLRKEEINKILGVSGGRSF